MGETSGRYYDGLLDRCAVRLSAGIYAVRARREAVVAPDPRIRLSRTDLVLRTQ